MDGKVRQYVKTTVWEATLLSAQQGNTSGVWYNACGVSPISFDIQGVVGDTIQLRGSNSPTEPAASEDGHLLNSAFTADKLAVLDSPIKWVKAKVTNWNSGSITVYALGYYNT
jgi:hypothetical protein